MYDYVSKVCRKLGSAAGRPAQQLQIADGTPFDHTERTTQTPLYGHLHEYDSLVCTMQVAAEMELECSGLPAAAL